MGSTEVLTWEADELRSGMRKIPGYAGHLTGMRHTLGMTYGRASADALGDGGENMCKKKWDSAILGHRHDGFTTAGALHVWPCIVSHILVISLCECARMALWGYGNG